MKLVVAHTVLLVFALGFAYQTWTRDAEATGPAPVLLWNAAPAELVSITYEGESGRVVLEHRQDDAGRYLWATIDRPDGQSRQFLVGQQTAELLEGFSAPAAIREIGIVNDEASMEEFGLAGEPTTVSVSFSGDRTWDLLVGEAVYGAGARYVKDVASDEVYLISASPINNLANADVSLRERQPHRFSFDEVASAILRTGEGERTMSRRAGSALAGGRWAPADAPGTTDQTFTNFMERVERLWITGFAPDLSPDHLERVLRIDYFGADESPIGYLELLRETGEDGTTYFVSTEHTRVLAQVLADTAGALDQDVRQLF